MTDHIELGAENNRIPIYGYTAVVLRYVHDIITEEFVNIGVLLYSKDADVFLAKVTKDPVRIVRMFGGLDYLTYMHYADYIEARVLNVKHEGGFKHMLDQVIAPNDGALQFGHFMGGISICPEKELERLYERLVVEYV